MHKNFTLKNGKTVLIRNAEPKDAVAVVDYFEFLAGTTIYTNQYPGQPKKEVAKLESDFVKENRIDILVFDGDKIVSTCGLFMPHFNHPWVGKTAQFGIHMLPDFRGKGLGSHLMQLLEQQAKDKNIHRIEGSVRTQNHTGIALYLKSGFIIEGTHKHKAFIDGVWHDEYSIAKLLD